MTTWNTSAKTTGLRLLGQLCLVVLLGMASTSHAMRIKEVAAIEGVRSNQLTGFGLVVGLDGTGDQTTQMPYTTQGLANYLQQLGITLPPTTPSPTAAEERGRRTGHRPIARLCPAPGSCWT
jgi:flagellar P-ring protein precursor FlgI